MWYSQIKQICTKDAQTAESQRGDPQSKSQQQVQRQTVHHLPTHSEVNV